MNDDPADAGRTDESRPLLPWPECDFFCIRGYAGTGTAACGWRGLGHQARRNGCDLVCPRCCGATLLRIPLNRD
jgi:hypothetical protein